MHAGEEQEIVQHGQEETNGIPRQIPSLLFRFSIQPHSSSKVPSSIPRTSVNALERTESKVTLAFVTLSEAKSLVLRITRRVVCQKRDSSSLSLS